MLLWTLGALLLAPTVAHAVAPVPDVSDTRIGAPTLNGAFVGAIDRPGDHDWYSLPGSDTEQPIKEIVDISVLHVGPGCTAPRPLLVVLRNSEGRWIHTYSISSERTDFVVPSFPGRHYLEIQATDSGCFELVYGLIIISQTIRTAQRLRTAADVAVGNNPTLCRIAHNALILCQKAVRELEKRGRAFKSAKARRRYKRAVKRAREKLDSARAKERRVCAPFKASDSA